MLILGESDDRALGALFGQIVIVGAIVLIIFQALLRTIKQKRKAPPPDPSH